MSNIVSKEKVIKDLRKHYSDDEIEVVFAYHKDYPIEDPNGDGKYRWVQKFDWQTTPGMDPNTIGYRYYCGDMTQEEYMDYIREIGYSLYGYWEVFVFNDRFDDEQYEEDMRKIISENRDNVIDNLI